MIGVILVIFLIAAAVVLFNRNASQERVDVQPVQEQETTKLAFVKDGDVWVKNGNQENKLTDYKYNFNISLASDSSKIAYLSLPAESIQAQEEAVHIGGLGLPRNLWVINFDGTDAKKITTESGYFGLLKFSPSGKYLSYLDYSGGELTVIDPGSGQIVSQNFVGGNINTDYVWADESTIYFTAVSKGIKLYLAEKRGIDISRLSVDANLVEQVGAIAPFARFEEIAFSLSPDGKKIAYFGKEVYTVQNLDGSDTKEILSKPESEKEPAGNVKFTWSGSSRYVAFFDKGSIGVFDVAEAKLYAVNVESNILVWDKQDNLYSGNTDGFRKINFTTGVLEDFMGKFAELNFGAS